jgi:hypothetical protein
MKFMMTLIALGGIAAYFFTKNRKVDLELGIEPKDGRRDTMTAEDERWLAAGAE